MTEPTNNTSAQREQLEAALEDAQQQQANLTRAIRLQFAQDWQNQTDLDALPIEASIHSPGMVEFTPEEGSVLGDGPVISGYEADAQSGGLSITLFMPDGLEMFPIDTLTAANRLGVSPDDLTRAVEGAGALVRDSSTLHRALEAMDNERIPQLESDLEAARGEHEASEEPAQPERGRYSLEAALDAAAASFNPVPMTQVEEWGFDAIMTDLEEELQERFGDVASREQIENAVTRYAEGTAKRDGESALDGMSDARREVSRALHQMNEQPGVAETTLRRAEASLNSAIESSLDSLHAQVGTELPEDTVEWATDSLDAPYTPERVTADWVQSTTMVQTYLECDRPDLAREWINTLDENLTNFADGGYPPGSDELEDVYHDAIARAAIPYGEAPVSPDDVRQQLGNINRPVPEFDLKRVREIAGMSPLDRDTLTRRLDAEPSLPTGVEDVAAARLSVRRAIADISENTEQAQTYLGSANEKLTHALQDMTPSQGRENVTAAQESLQQASEKVTAVAETAERVDAEVTVYTTDGCPGCFATKRALDKAGVEYDEIPLQDHPELLAQFKRQLGKEGEKITAPVVQTKDGDLWSGYNPGKLKEHGLDHRTRQQRSGETGRDTGYGR